MGCPPYAVRMLNGQQEAVSKGRDNDGGKVRFLDPTFLVSAILRWAFSFQTALLRFMTMLVFLNRGHWCACPCDTAGTDHLVGKWVSFSARLDSPEKSPVSISHLLGGCSVPLWL